MSDTPASAEKIAGELIAGLFGPDADPARIDGPLFKAIAAAIQSERSSAAQREREALERAAQTMEEWGEDYAAAIRRLKDTPGPQFERVPHAIIAARLCVPEAEVAALEADIGWLYRQFTPEEAP